MLEIWISVQEYIFLSLFLIIAIILKRKIKFLQRFLIPIYYSRVYRAYTWLWGFKLDTA